MTVLYIILGILVGVPTYLLVNTVLMLISRLFAAIAVGFGPGETTDSSFMNEIRGGGNSYVRLFGKSGKIFGCFYFIIIVFCLVIALIYRLFWLVYRVFRAIFRAWFKLIKFCWNLGAVKKED